jgi:Flp pilus assembly protein TadD
LNPAGRRRLAVAWVILLVGVGLLAYLFKLDPRLWTHVGDRQLRNDELVHAERSFQRALDIDVNHVPALYGLGWAYLRAGLDTQARERFQRMLDVAPDDPGGHRGMAAVEVRAGMARSAEERLRRAYDLAPHDPGVVTDLAGIYLDAGHVAEARSLFDRAVELAPDRAEFQLARAEGSLAAGQIDEARAQVAEARELRTRNRRFAAAADELLVRAALLEVDSILEGEVPTEAECSAAQQLLGDAEEHLRQAEEAGLADDLARQDRRRLGRNRQGMEARCGRGVAREPEGA